MGAGNFRKDLHLGQDVEKIVLNYLVKLGCEVDEELNDNNKYDFKVKTPKGDIVSYEIKSDYKITEKYDTGNIYVEHTSRGKSSGINTTQADWFCYYFVHLNQGWFIKMDELREMIKEEYFRSGCAIDGDGSKSYGYLIPRLHPDIKKLFIVKNLLK